MASLWYPLRWVIELRPILSFRMNCLEIVLFKLSPQILSVSQLANPNTKLLPCNQAVITSIAKRFSRVAFVTVK